MERSNDERIKALQDSGVELYSISKLDNINNCLYASYLTYRQGIKGNNNIYAIIGTKMHEVLEAIARGEATEKDLAPALESELLDVELFGFKFPTEQIRDSWIQDMTHFCNNYKMAEGVYDTEQLFIYKTDDGHYLRGYIDLIDNHFDGTIDIYDHKSSSMYSSKGIEEHARQLIVYMLAKQQEGYKVNKIAWHFMKYVNVTFRNKKGQMTTKIIERRKIGSELLKYVSDMLDPDAIDTDLILNQFIATNDINVLPQEIGAKFDIKPCILEYEVAQESIDACKQYIADTITKWESLADKGEEAYPPREFTTVQKSGKIVDDSFFCGQLCGYNNRCSYYNQYLLTKDNKKEDDNLF